MLGDVQGAHPIWRQVRLAWEIVSDRLGGNLEPILSEGQGEIGATIALSLDAVDLIISHGKRYNYTRIQTAAPDSSELSLTVWPKYRELPPAAFHQELFLFDEEMLDEMFHFFANDPELAFGWLDDDIQEVLSRASCYGFVLDNEILTAERDVLESDSSDLASAVRAAAVLASAGTLKYIPRWRELAEKIGGEFMIKGDRWRSGDHALIAWKVNERPIQLVVSRSRLVGRARGVSLSTQVRAELVSPSLERYVVSDSRVSGLERLEVGEGAFFEEYQVWTSEPSVSQRRFTKQICEKISALEPRYIETNGEVLSLGFRGFEMTPERLKVAGEIVAELALPALQTAYR